MRDQEEVASHHISRRPGGVDKNLIDHTTSSTPVTMLRDLFLVSRPPPLG